MKNAKSRQKRQEWKDRGARIQELANIRKIQSKNPSKALTEIGEYIKKYPNDLYGKYEYGIILMSIQNYEKAKELLEEVENSDCQNKYSAMTAIAKIYQAQENYKKAIEYLMRAIEESPYDETAAKTSLAGIYEDKGDFAKAEDILRTMVTRTEHRDLALAKLALLKKDPDTAYQIASKIPQTADHIFNRTVKKELGKILIAKGELEWAELYLDSALEDPQEAFRGPDDEISAEVLLNKATVKLLQGAYSEGKSICKALMRKRPDHVDALITLGRIEKNQGNNEAARQYFVQAASTTTKSKYWLGYYELAALEKQERNYEQALEYLEQCNPRTYVRKRKVKINEIALNIRLNRMQEASEITEELRTLSEEEKNSREYRLYRIFLDKELGLPPTIKKGKNYPERQYADYSASRAISQIREEHQSGRADKSVFREDIDIGVLMAYAQERLNESTLKKIGEKDVYILEYPNVGNTATKEPSDWLCVLTLPNTNQIYMMMPENKTQEPTKTDDNKPYQKRKTQIEKFYARYGSQSPTTNN